MEYQILFSGNNKKNVISLSSAEFTQGTVKVKVNFSATLIQYFLFQRKKIFTELSMLLSDRCFHIEQTLFIILFIIYIFASTLFLKVS